MKISTFVSIVVFILALSVYSLVTQEWVKRYNGTGSSDDAATVVKTDAAGNIYVTGYSKGTGSNFDIVTLKYNSAGVQQWVNRFDGIGNSEDRPNSMVLDASGNVYVTGFTRHDTTRSSEDYCTIKYNNSGVQQWIAIYNGPGDDVDFSADVKVDESSNVYVTGGSAIGDYFHCTTIKYNSSGIQQWVQSNDSASRGYSIALDNSGNVYVAGVISYPRIDFLIIKYNSSGAQQWLKRNSGLGENNHDPKMVTDVSGNVYVTGAAYTGGWGHYFTFKYNSAGIFQWQKTYIGPLNRLDYPNDIKVDAAGNVYVTGSSNRITLNTDCTTIKYNSSGVQQWVQRYIAADNLSSIGYCLSLDSWGNIYVSGKVQQAGQQGYFYDYLTLKYSPSGVQKWIQTYNGPGNSSDVAVSNAVDAANNVYVTGFSIGFGTYADYATIKYSQGSSIYWIIREKIDFISGVIDTLVLSQILPQNYGRMLKNNLSGAVKQLDQNHPNVAIIRMNLFKFEVNLLIQLQILPFQLAQPLIAGANEVIGLIQNMNVNGNNLQPVEEKLTFSLEQNFPNPFNPSTKIRYEIPFNSFVTLKVYDVLGRETAALVSEDLSEGIHEVQWNASKYASGIYFYKLTAEIDGQKFEKTMKMTLVK